VSDFPVGRETAKVLLDRNWDGNNDGFCLYFRGFWDVERFSLPWLRKQSA
jgi:hypothetical protein